MSRPTLRDVAAKAGLSVTQVSRALNDHDDVADATKELARKVAAELRYLPNLEARRLKDPSARTGVIGIILTNDSLRFSDPYFGELLSSMVSAAGEAGRQLSLSTHPSGTPETAPYDEAVRRKQVDGFVLLRTRTDDPRISFLLEQQVPFVSFGRPDGRQGFGAVEVASDCFTPVVQHLLDLGHDHVACVSEPTRFAMGAARLEAFTDAAKNAGLELGAHNIVECGFHEGSGRDAGLALFDRKPSERPTAVVAMNDLLALGVLDAATDHGLGVPDDVTIVGFDDIRAARQVRPALTTVRQDADQVGRSLIELLVPAIDAGHPVHGENRIATTLETRQSSGPPPSRPATAPLQSEAGL